MERHGGAFEGDPNRDKHHADDEAGGWLRGAAEQSRDIGEARRAGEAVDQRGAVEQHSRGERAEHKVFEAGLGRAHRIPVEARDDVERQTLQFEAEIEGDQIIGRDHHHHPGGGEQHQDRKFEACDLVLLVVAEPHDDCHRRAEQHQRLHEDGEGVVDEHAVEADLPLAAEETGDNQGRDQHGYRQPRHELARSFAA